MSLDAFHPAVSAWFSRNFAAPTAPQLAAWPAIQAGRHTLIAAPTGSGKTLAAFLTAIDVLVREATSGSLADGVQVVYVSPLKALSNDIQRNLEAPLAGIARELESRGATVPAVRALVRTGDTPPSERAAMRRTPPHILVTTPESLYLLVTSESGRKMLAGVRTVIVDEIHAIAGNKRGSHLTLTLERLCALAGRRVQRIGLSATQKPIDEVAAFLTGRAVESADPDACVVVDSGHGQPRDVALVLPDAPLEVVMSNEVWDTLYDRIASLTDDHRTTLVFCNTRRQVERVTRHLSDRLGTENVAAHHGSLAKEQRLEAEQRLKDGRLRVLVATASLELGIDIGDVELVCQLGTPRSIATFLQRVGRANHSVGGIPKGRLFPTSRDELVECTALLSAVRAGELDRLRIPPRPLDVLAQQIVAEVAARDMDEAELHALCRRAWPYRDLSRAQFDEVVRMLVDGYTMRRGHSLAYLHRDAVHGRLRARRGARLTALTCGSAIPMNADYSVVLEPAGTFIGTLNEDFAIESLAGDVFQLGNASYRILRIESGRVRVEDAAGQPPNIPFWLGEAPARTDELSAAVSALRQDVDALLPDFGDATIDAAVAAIARAHRLERAAARQLVEYLAGAKAALGLLPTQSHLVIERFFDEAGGMQLVVHAPFGARINRAFGLALRKRFCQSFNFELQAAATEDAIVLSLGETHSFALDDVPHYLNSRSVRAVLTQAVLDAPLFLTRWRWNATVALAVRTSRGGKKTPPPLQRMAAEDLISVVFPDQLACQENLRGEREIPDHPLVRQTLDDCLQEAMDLPGLEVLLRDVEDGRRAFVTRDLPRPSPLAMEILNARPYAFLDDAPLEERRTQAVAARRWLDPQNVQAFGQLDTEAIERVRGEAWPQCETPDELHDALMGLGLLDLDTLTAAELALFAALVEDRRATTLGVGTRRFAVAAEQLPLAVTLHPSAALSPFVSTPASMVRDWTFEDAARELLRGQLQARGPIDTTTLAAAVGLDAPVVDVALLALEQEGFALRGRYTPQAPRDEWCERRLLARIHRYTLKSLRAEIEPVSSVDFLRFLLDWHGITRDPPARGAASLEPVVDQLEGFEAAAGAWESEILPARLADYEPRWLDALCLSGRVLWTRVDLPRSSASSGPMRSTPIALLKRSNATLWAKCAAKAGLAPLSSTASAVADALREHGASFADDLQATTRLLPTQLEGALGELVAAGQVTADAFAGLRGLLMPLQKRHRIARRARRGGHVPSLDESGRWSLLRRASEPVPLDEAEEERIARRLLDRYGVVFRKLLTREADSLPPWHVLVRIYRRLEARGEIRGGRFVASAVGEQYALPEAVTRLRAVRKAAPTGRWVVLSAADPLNLVGLLTPGSRLASLAGNRLALRDGVPVGTLSAGEITALTPLDATETADLRRWLTQDRRTAARAQGSGVGAEK